MEVEKEKKKKEETDQDETEEEISTIPGDKRMISMYGRGDTDLTDKPWIKMFSTSKPEDSDIISFCKSKFEYHGIPLHVSAEVSAINKDRWEIVDGEKKYKIEKRGQQLDIYMYSEIGGRL